MKDHIKALWGAITDIPGMYRLRLRWIQERHALEIEMHNAEVTTRQVRRSRAMGRS